MLFLTYLSGSFTLRRFFPEGLTGLVDLYVAFVFFMLLVGIVLREVARDKFAPEDDVPRPIFHWVLGVMVLHSFLVMSVWWSLDARYGDSILSRTLVVPYLMAIALCVFRASEKNAKGAMRLLLGLIGIVGVIFGIAGLIQGMGEGNRLAAFGGGPNIFARTVGAAALVLIFYYLRDRGHWYLLIPVPLLVACLLLAGSRGGWIAMGVAACYLVVALRLRFKPSAVQYGLLGALAVAGVMGGLAYHQEAVYQRTVMVNVEGHNAGRIEMLGAGVKGFLSSPLRGIGLGGYSAIGPEIKSVYGQEYDRTPDYPHNIVVDVAVTGGVIGLALLAKVVLLFIRAARERIPTALSHLFASLALLHLVGQLFSGTFYDGRWLWLFMLLYLLSSEDKTTGEEANR